MSTRLITNIGIMIAAIHPMNSCYCKTCGTLSFDGNRVIDAFRIDIYPDTVIPIKNRIISKPGNLRMKIQIIYNTHPIPYRHTSAFTFPNRLPTLDNGIAPIAVAI